MGKWVHRLSDINTATKTAICAACGPTTIRYKKYTDWWACKHPTTYGRVYRATKKPHCESCGFVPVHKCQLDVDHIDGNHKNDSPGNHQTLCANCHRLKTHKQKTRQ